MKRKYLITLISSFILLLVIASGVGFFILREISSISAREVEQLIAKRTDCSVVISKVTPRWVGINLIFTIESLTLQNEVTNLPLLHAAFIESKLSFWQTIRNLKVRFSQVTIDTPKVVINVPIKKSLALQDLNEYLSKQTNIAAALEYIGDVKNLNIVNGSIILPYTASKDFTIDQINLYGHSVGHRNYKFHGICRIASQEQSYLAIDGRFSGQFSELSKANAILNIKGENLNLISYLNFFTVATNIQQMVGKEVNTTLIWRDGKLHKIKGKFLLNDVAFADHSKIQNVAITADYLLADKVGKFKLENFEYYNKNIFATPIHIQKLRGNVTWQYHNDKVLFDFADLIVEAPDVKLKAAVGASYYNGKINDLTFHGITDLIAVEAAHKYVPTKILPKELTIWITDAIRSGTILSNSLVYRKGKFDWMMNFKDVTLAYAPDWPAFTDLSGNLHLNGKQITILGISGKILEIPIGVTTATVLDLDKEKNTPLIIDGEVSTTLPQGVRFLLSSPLRQIGETLATYKPQGNMHLDLKLKIPLADDQIIPKINGKLLVAKGAFTDANFGVGGTKVEGVIDFTEQTISGDKLTLKLLDQEAVAQINYDENKTPFLHIAVNTKFKDRKLVTLFPILDTVKLKGESMFTIDIQAPVDGTNKKQIIIDSDLTGIAVSFPPLFEKTKEEAAHFSLKLDSNDLSKLQVTYKEVLNGTLLLGGNKLKAGDLVFGEQADLDTKNVDLISIKGKLPEFDVDPWLQVVAKNHDVVNIPINLDILINKLKIFNNQFDAVLVKYNTKDKLISLKGDKIVGVIRLAADGSPIKLEFEKLIIDKLEDSDLKIKTLTPNNLPTLQFNCADLTVASDPIGEIKFKLTSKLYGYDIADLHIKNKIFELLGQGQWNMLDKQTTQLSGNITSKNFGKMFENWGVGNSIRQGAGKIAFTFSWDGNPVNVKFANTVGDVNLDATSGQIVGVDPGFGRIIGLLSLDNIQRRLKLDFSDLMGKGFAFDKLQTNFNINHGKLHTDGIFIDGPSAYIALVGDAYIQTKQINFKMGVMPKVGASLPLAAAITAGNPAIGAAFWILGKAVGSKDSSKDTLRYSYDVTGSWEKPEIHEIKVKKKEK